MLVVSPFVRLIRYHLHECEVILTDQTIFGIITCKITTTCIKCVDNVKHNVISTVLVNGHMDGWCVSVMNC